MSKPLILVTGANGQLGKEFNALAVSFPQNKFIFLSKDELLIDHFDDVKNAFKKYQPQYCINCAAYTAVDKAETEKELAWMVNAEAVTTLALVCKDFNTRFIHFSTDYVFDGNAANPYKEDDPTNPQSVYGYSKLQGEQDALQANTDSIIIRTSWVYSQFGKNFVKTMLKLMSERDEINVVSDQIGSPTYAADLAEATMQIITQLTTHHSPFTIHGIYHYSNTGIISWFDFATAIKEISGSNCKVNPIPTSQYPTPAKRPSYSVLDKTKIQQTFGIELKDWKQSLKVCIEKIKEEK